jgi:hypothetical protein
MMLWTAYVSLGQSWGVHSLFVSGQSTCKCAVLQQLSRACRKGDSEHTGWTPSEDLQLENIEVKLV